MDIDHPGTQPVQSLIDSGDQPSLLDKGNALKLLDQTIDDGGAVMYTVLWENGATTEVRSQRQIFWTTPRQSHLSSDFERLVSRHLHDPTITIAATIIAFKELVPRNVCLDQTCSWNSDAKGVSEHLTYSNITR